MSSKARLAAVVSAAAIGLTMAVGPIATAAPPQTATPVDAIAINEVGLYGQNTIAVAVKFDREITLGEVLTPAAAIQVAVTRTLNTGTTTTARTVIGAHVAKSAAAGWQTPSGEYLIIKLDPADANAATSYYTNVTSMIPLDGAFEVTFATDLRDAAGEVVLTGGAAPLRNTSVADPIIDQFEALSFTDSQPFTRDYRFFKPQAYRDNPDSGAEYPLVIALHGSGERGGTAGQNNIQQLASNQMAVSFAFPANQARHPAFVVAPQSGTSGWNTADKQAWIINLLNNIAGLYPVDTDRVYITGLSMGSIGSWALLPNHPDVFAGALLVCGTGAIAPAVANLKDVPIWATHSIDDGTVNYTGATSDYNIMRGMAADGQTVVFDAWDGNLPTAQAATNASAQVAAATAAGSNKLFTTYNRGTTVGNTHWSWVPTYDNPAIIDWLYSNVRGHDLGVGDIPIEIRVPGVEGPVTPPAGQFSWTVANGAAVALGTAVENAGSYVALGQLPDVVVTDTRAAKPAWTVTGTVSEFAAWDQRVSGRYLGWTPSVAANTVQAVPGARVAPNTALGLSTPKALAYAVAGHATGSATVGAELELALPLSTPAGAYRATLTLTAIG
ncbi:MAG: hypothetical protein LBT54_00760 [Bifidobacteriaceae bacterium]|jgi:predicted peptidase|nr:hypothetical protein [Bifidobacteriaceae bacterium]